MTTRDASGSMVRTVSVLGRDRSHTTHSDIARCGAGTQLGRVGRCSSRIPGSRHYSGCVALFRHSETGDCKRVVHPTVGPVGSSRLWGR